MNGFDYEKKRNENKELINLNAAQSLASGKKIIQNTLNKSLSGYNDRLKKIPEIYQNMKNNLTNTNNKELKKMNENIANTGNHNAGGYAISKRLNNINSFNKAQSDIDKAKQNEISDIKNKMADAKQDAQIEMAKLDRDVYSKKLDMAIEENNRDIDFNFEKEKFGETKRVNDASIAKINNDILLANNEDKRKADANIREWEIHNIEKNYRPLKYDQELLNMKNDNRLTEEKIKTEGIRRSTLGSAGRSGSGSGTANNKLTQLSAKDLANNLINQIGRTSYDSYGNKEVKFSEDEAYIYLMEWKKKYNLPDYMVNDVSIILGIQDYI